MSGARPTAGPDELPGPRSDGTGPADLRRAKLLFIVSAALSSGQFTRGVFIIYMLSQGLSLVQVGIAESFYQLGRFASEVPFGALADRWQRQRVIQLGYAIHALAMLLYLVGSGLLLYSIVFVLLGARMAAQSGADSALLYDYLQTHGAEDEFARINGQSAAAGYVVLATATFTGGLLLGVGQWLPFVGEALCVAVAAVLIGRFPETVPDARTGVEAVRYWQTIGTAVRIIRGTRLLTLFVLFTALLETGTGVISILSQDYFVDRGLSVPQTTFFLGLAILISAVAAFHSHRLVKRGPTTTLIVSAAIYVVGMVVMVSHHPVAAVIGFLLVFINIDFLYPALRQFFNRHTTSAVRSTALSLQSFLAGLGAFVAFPIATLVVHHAGYSALVIGIAAITAPPMALIIVRSLRLVRATAGETNQDTGQRAGHKEAEDR